MQLASLRILLFLALAFAMAPLQALAEDGASPQVLFLIGEDEYQTRESLSAFASEQLKPRAVESKFVFANENDPNRFDGLEAALGEADLLFVSVRRRTPPPEQLKAIQAYLSRGNPLIGIRTASHAFAALPGTKPAKGYAEWTTFNVDVLGGRYEGHLGASVRGRIEVVPAAKHHPVMAGIADAQFSSGTTLYRSVNLAKTTTVLLEGITLSEDKPERYPVAWTNQFQKSRVFYTSLGHTSEFQQQAFNRMLLNAIFWCLEKEPPAADKDERASSRHVNRDDVAANEDVREVIRSFKGLGAVGDNSQPTPPNFALPRFKVKENLELELVAAEPDVQQPVSMTWDERGRLWVVQYLQYPVPAGLKIVKYDQYLRAVFDKIPEAPPRHTPGADKVTVFEDTDGDGRFDTSKDVLTGLNIVSSVAIGGGGIWVLNPPYLLFFPDADGDDAPDGDPEVHLSGFGLEDTHAIANSLTWGPDGWLYGANGSTTTGNISSAATRNVSFKGQMIWRYHPRTKVFEIFAEGGGNTFGLEIDRRGQIFSGTNQGKSRGMHYVQGGYGSKSWGKHGALTNPYAFGYFEHMRLEGFEERFTHAQVLYEGGSLPEEFNGAMVSVNSLHNYVVVSDLLRDSSTYRTKDREKIVTTSDQWFRPVDIKVGPDGAIYLADWYDTRLTHVDPRDNWHKSSGRIYRLKAKGKSLERAMDLRQLSDDDLIELLDDPNQWRRFQAVRLLGERKHDATRPKLERLLAESPGDAALRALWGLNWMNQLSDESILVALRHKNADVRRWGVRLVGDRNTASPSVAKEVVALAANEADVQVRSQLASSAKRLPGELCLAIIRRLIEHSADIEDIHLPLLVWWAIESKVESDREKVLGFFLDSAVWSAPMVEKVVLTRVMQRQSLARDFEACEKLLELAPDDRRRRLLVQGLMAAYQGRRISDLPPSLASTLAGVEEAIGSDAVALGLRLGKKEAIDEAHRIIRDSSADLALRLSYIEILGEIDRPECVGPLLKLLNETDSGSLQRAAMAALAHYPDEKIALAIFAAYKSRLSGEAETQATALRVLASRVKWAQLLLMALDNRELDRERIPLDIVQQMKLHRDPAIDASIAKHWGRIQAASPAEKQAEISRIRRVIHDMSDADPRRGEPLFVESCGKCHRLFAKGGKAGPDLTGYERTNLDFLLLAIVDPSAAIREEFTSFGIVTDDGRTFTGLIEEQDTRTIKLRDANGEQVVIDRDRVEHLQATATSMMPDGLLSKLNDRQIKDLFAYLMRATAETAYEYQNR